jgi:hypothetical protein
MGWAYRYKCIMSFQIDNANALEMFMNQAGMVLEKAFRF